MVQLLWQALMQCSTLESSAQAETVYFQAVLNFDRRIFCTSRDCVFVQEKGFTAGGTVQEGFKDMVTEREDKRGKPGDSWQLEQCRRFALLHKGWEEGVEAEEEGDREQAWAKVREFMAAASRTHTHTCIQKVGCERQVYGNQIQFSVTAEISTVQSPLSLDFALNRPFLSIIMMVSQTVTLAFNPGFLRKKEDKDWKELTWANVNFTSVVFHPLFLTDYFKASCSTGITVSSRGKG